MDHIEFVKQLQDIPLEKSAYREAGLDDKFIETNKKRYIASKRRIQNKTHLELHDPIISLVSEYKVSSIEIGMINFNNKISDSLDFIVFGTFEIDRLAISKMAKEVVLLDEISDKILMYCASNGENFLEAAIHIGKFLEKRVIDENLYDDANANLLMAEKCSKIAGGDKYLDFYKMMLGI